ncbi:MAG: pantetheine-phosphate adenylyltransferase [Deferribacteraceae bacterium]|jgi:pantetheine-phosphate adenylyltransferase|nr:pantetheine-phosphate adenylyltransferase [Deferribacteraceae bacterium]
MNIIYPGTFDPFSLGQLDIVIRARQIYDTVTVAVSDNPRKNPMFAFEERIEMARLAVDEYDGVEVIGFTGLLVDVMRERGIKFMLRGIRGMLDFEYEFQMAQVNRSMLSEFEPIFLMPGEKYMVLSSTFIREVAVLNGDVSGFLPPKVAEYIKAKI